jgi:uncharacterized membrane protein (UPF0127 family)
MRIVIVSALVLLVVGVQVWASPQWVSPRATVVFKDQTRVTAEIADTDDKRQRGLMFREALDQNEGMIFIFDEPGFYPFWMKNTLISLDMLWVDVHGKIVSIAQSVPPCEADPCPSYPPIAGSSALYVVEVVAGFTRQHGVKVGDTLIIEGF